MNRRHHILILAAALVTFALTGCAGNQAEAGLPPDDTAVVQVENDNIVDMRISILRAPSAATYRLGIAAGSRVTTLKVPRSLVTGVSEVTFEITPVSGGQRAYSRTITISPGDEILLRIPPQ